MIKSGPLPGWKCERLSVKQPWIKFYSSDWRADVTLGTCSLAARGLWMEMLCIMNEAESRGSLAKNGAPFTVAQIAALARAPIGEVKKLLIELEQEGVFSRDPDGTIYSRRIRRDIAKEERDKANGNRPNAGNPLIRRGTVPKDQRIRGFRRSDAPAKTLRIFDRDGGRCHWCDEELDFEHFHVDHVVAVCDGGTNDEDNLVAACPICNGMRATEPTPRMVRHQYKKRSDFNG